MLTSVEGSKPEIVQPGSFEAERHFYPRVLNAHIHPLASFFFNLSHERIISRYCHLNPRVDPQALRDILSDQPKHFLWGGADLIHCTSADGKRRMVVIETNSSPSGNKSMPLLVDHDDQGSYRQLVQRTFVPLIKKQRSPKGEVAVLYDKNYMENSGYAAVLADCLGRPVCLVPFFATAGEKYVRSRNGGIEIRKSDESNEWMPVRAALRYVTQQPWSRIPVNTRTLLFNPIVACLAGGRNKLVASMAYDLLNADLQGTGLAVSVPETIREVSKAEVPLILKTLGNKGVIKVPYSNAGQGVYTITRPADLEAFLAQEFVYDRFVVQSLIGNYQWSSNSKKGQFYQVGTVPDKRNKLYVADVRMTIGSSASGYYPCAVYARRARDPLLNELGPDTNSWDMLVTNLSLKVGVDSWNTDTSRLLLFDRRDFNRIGIGLDALISGFIQGVLAMTAIDRMANSLLTSKGRFRMKLFRSINNDPALHSEILRDSPVAE
jgi:hypothetical protein